MAFDEGRREKAMFSMRGVQKDEGGEETVIEFITEGDIIFKDDCILLKYEETELSGMMGNSTSLLLREGSVSMVREGDMSVTMLFEKGKQYVSYFNTPHGAISISVLGNSVFHSVDENGGRVELDYTLGMDGVHSVESSLFMDIKVRQ